MSFLNIYIKKYWKLFITAVMFLTLEAMCDLMQPTIMSKIIDIGVKNKNVGYVLKMGFVMLGVTGLGAVAAVTRNIISSNVSQRFSADLRYELFKKIQTLSFESIDKFDTSSLITRLTNDVTQVQIFAHGMMRIFVKAPILCIGSIVMAVVLNPYMSLILIAVVPVIGVLIFLSMRTGYPYFRRIQRAMDRVNGIIREYLSGVRVVKAFNRFSYETERFEAANEELSRTSMTAMRIMAVFSPGITLTVNLGIAAVLWIGGLRVRSGSIQVGQIIAFINYMTQVLISLMMISVVFNMFIRAKASAERIGEVMMEKNNMIFSDKPVKPKELRGRIDFENVTFSYTGDIKDAALRDITFSCMPGETLGIIGSTGSGKSTIINLISRFYDSLSGSVKVDGVDVKEMDLKDLRERIAVVPQKTLLFTGTVEENIRWGKEDASFEEVKRAAEVAQAHEFISKTPEGFNTLLGQGGVNFSGGQKQRVSIARALIKKPEILILDDCTSAVDVATEGKIMQGLREYSSNLTCIIIAQRITSVMKADKIIVLDNGRISGMGTHEELMQACEIYRDIFQSQIGREMM